MKMMLLKMQTLIRNLEILLNMTVNETFLNPSQEEIELWDKCDFQPDFISTIQNHSADRHPMCGCRWKQEFVSKAQHRKHNQKIHNIIPFSYLLKQSESEPGP